MEDNKYSQFRVSNIEEIEFDINSDREESVLRLFLESRTGDQIALELPQKMWTEVFAALSSAMKQFPGGGLRQ